MPHRGLGTGIENCKNGHDRVEKRKAGIIFTVRLCAVKARGFRTCIPRRGVVYIPEPGSCEGATMNPIMRELEDPVILPYRRYESTKHRF
jgi:hypothetical protein